MWPRGKVDTEAVPSGRAPKGRVLTGALCPLRGAAGPVGQGQHPQSKGGSNRARPTAVSDAGQQPGPLDHAGSRQKDPWDCEAWAGSGPKFRLVSPTL